MTAKFQRAAPSGMAAFVAIWSGQLLSLLCTGMTQFALTIWAWDITGQATALALVAFFNFTPRVILSPLAGALVDRWNRKLVMAFSDLASGLATSAILALYLSGGLQIWHLYVAGAWTGAFQAFQFPAYSASISLMLPKEQYGRANGMLALTEFAPEIATPILAGVLLTIIGVGGVMALDVITFVLALAILLAVHVPQPSESDEGREAAGSLLQESLFGFRYILARPSLLGLQMVFFTANFTFLACFAILPPLILSRTGSSEIALGSVQSAAGIGGVAGGVLMGAWGGPKRRIHGILLSMIASSLLGQLALSLGQSLPVWLAASFLMVFFIPIMDGCNQAIWQAKVSPDIQGRVFGSRLLIAQLSGPLAILIVGPLADAVFEPAMRSDGSLAPMLGRLFGSAPGAGMAVMVGMFALLGIALFVVAYSVRPIRLAETLLPDFDESAPAQSASRQPIA